MVMEVICFTTSGELNKSITRLWTRSSNRSHVLVPRKQEYSSNIKSYYKTFQSSSKQINNALLYKNMLYKDRKLRSLPSPQGDFLVVMLRTLVGILTGPLTLSFLSLDPRIKSAHTVIQNSYTYWYLQKKTLITKPTSTVDSPISNRICEPIILRLRNGHKASHQNPTFPVLFIFDNWCNLTLEHYIH